MPHGADKFIRVSTAYLRYGPHSNYLAGIVLVAFSSIVIILACAPLFDALRSSGPKSIAKILLAPLILFSLLQLAQAGHYLIRSFGTPSPDIFNYLVYFWPELMVREIAGLPSRPSFSGSMFLAFWTEVAKWSIVSSIAVWLSIAQFTAWRQAAQKLSNEA